ncbi:MAG: hypothetical protein QM796_10060 [Chthoniobacteraceae bacterium]
MERSPKYLLTLFLIVLLFLPSILRATFNYDYGDDEYVTVSEGISPDGKFAITTHGEGEYGYDHFHVYLFDAVTGRKIGPLEEIAESLDTGAGAFGALWSRDSRKVTIVYRVDRHAPLKAMTYKIGLRRAYPMTKAPVDLSYDSKIADFWSAHCSDSKPPIKVFGTPRKSD